MINMKEAISRGMFKLESVKADEKILKEAQRTIDALPASMRDAYIESLSFTSYKYSKNKIQLNVEGNEDIIKCLVVIDTLSSNVQFVFEGAIYKTDAQIVKLSSKLNEITGIDSEEIRSILVNNINDTKNANKNPTFDMSVFQSALDDILSNEDYILDFELMNYKKIVGTRVVDGETVNVYSSITHDVLMNTIATNENARALNNDVKPLTKELISYLQYYNDKLKEQALGDIIEATKYNPEYEGFFEKYAKLWHETYNAAEDIDVFTVGLKQAIWNMKRLTRELPTYNDLTLTFRGAQGIGKGFMVNAIFGTVLGKFYNPSAKISDIIDERWTPALGNMLLVNIDEADVGGGNTHMSEKAMAPLKSRITNTRFTFRPMRTNTTVEIVKKASFISTSNFHIYEIMNDSTGMRRFLEFNSRNANQQRFNSDNIQKLKSFALKAFQSIDENNDKGYWDLESETGKKITSIQESYVNKPAIVEFCAKLEIVEDMKYADCVAIEALYDQYEAYCIDQGVKEQYRVSKKNFRRKMEDIIDGCTKVQGNVHRFRLKFKAEENVLDDKAVHRPSYFKFGELE